MFTDSDLGHTNYWRCNDCTHYHAGSTCYQYEADKPACENFVRKKTDRD